MVGDNITIEQTSGCTLLRAKNGALRYSHLPNIRRLKYHGLLRTGWQNSSLVFLKHNVLVQRRRYTVRWNQLLDDRFFVALSEALEGVYATFWRGRSDQGSSPCSRPLQSHGQTSPGNAYIRRLPPRPGVGSSNRR